MPLRPCLGGARNEQGHTLVADGNRCPECRAEVQQTKDAKRPARRTYGEQQRRRRAVIEHVTLYGWLCPGAPDMDHAPHPCTDLTADHVETVATGGAEGGALRVLCRSANSGRGATARRVT